MVKIRVLVVDDSVVIRRMLSDCLAADPELEIVGTAADGSIALEKIAQLNPDLVTLDIEMPVMDGLETVKAIRQKYRRLPVIMFSTLTERGASATLDALALGANDYVTKPANMGSVLATMQKIRDDLTPKIKALSRPRLLSAAPAAAAVPPPVPFRLPRASTGIGKVEMVVIGVSTGGPNALVQMLPQLMANFPVPILIVQHMPPIFTRMLAERISNFRGLNAREGKQGVVIGPGEIWIAPGGYHMEVQASTRGVKLSVHEGATENSCRPAVDVLFRSVAKVYGSRTLAVVLTGMGQDGLLGARAIREAGGQVIVQDEASSVIWGMPGAVAQAGLADKILPLEHIADEINRRCPRQMPSKIAPLSLAQRLSA